MVDDFLRDHGLDVRAGILAALARLGTSRLWPAAGGRYHLYAGGPALQHANPLHASDLASFVMVGTAFIYFSILFYV